MLPRIRRISWFNQHHNWLNSKPGESDPMFPATTSASANHDNTTTGRPGELMKRWSREHPRQSTGAIDLRALQQVNEPPAEPTQALPSINMSQVTGEIKLSIPRYIEYKLCTDQPLQLLYGAVLTGLSRLKTLPKELIISPARLSALREQSRELTGRVFDNRYHLYYGPAIDAIPVHVELPPVLKIVLKSVPYDYAIAVYD